MADYKDYYKILGVSKTAGDAELKKAFKAQARKYHPDMHPEAKKAEMTEKFKDINEAYEVLSDKQKRAIYDQVGSADYQNYARGGGASSSSAGAGRAYGGASGARGGQNQYYQDSGGANPFGGMGGGSFKFNSTGGFNQGDFSDFFQQIFGGMGGMGGMSGFGGTSRSAQNFGGYEDDDVNSLDSQANLTLNLEEAYNGGRVSLTLPNGKTAQVNLPAKIADGAKIKLKGYGNKTRQGAGDLYITVKIAPKAGFKLEGNDIYQTVNIMPWTAALGGEASVPMPGGGSVNIKVPAGTQGGAKLKLSGKGLGKDGNMYVEFAISIPKNLTKAQKELFAKLSDIS